MSGSFLLAYIGPGYGPLLDPRGPWLYVIAIGALALLWFLVSQLRGGRGDG